MEFLFDGKAYAAQPGDTVAAALLRHGVMLMGRSFKYHRPRGPLGVGSEEPNALVTIDESEGGRFPGRVTPNVRATVREVTPGLVVRSQNSWGSLRRDLGAVNDRLAPLFPAGFYNKTFKWPKSFWDRVYEPAIRRAAGLGPAPTAPDPDVYASTYAHCDVLIVGAGEAGLTAALELIGSGKVVWIVDEGARAGGQLLHAREPSAWLADTLDKLHAAPDIRLLTRTAATGHYHGNFVTLRRELTDHLSERPAPGTRARTELVRLRAGKVILAQGAIERPLVFNGNDRPGVMLASAARGYLGRFGVRVGARAAVFTSHDGAYRAAFDLADAGVEVPAILDLRAEVDPQLIEQAKARSIEVLTSTSVIATKGRLRLSGLTAWNRETGARREFACDTLLVSGGWTPSLHLWSHAKGTIRWEPSLSAYLPDRVNENMVCVGACNGEGLGNGEVFAEVPSPIPVGKQRAFVDFQNDVTSKDIHLAVREGFHSVEHVKRYTTNGMATDQGRTSNLNALEITARLLDVPPEQVGLTTFRPPFSPTTFGAVAGYRDDELFDPVRKTSIDGWAEAHGAVFEPVGHWRRARYFPEDNEDMDAATLRECRVTREAVGLFDASTLGKIEVVGPDAARFMNRMYTNAWTKLAVGGCRYGVMLREDGYVYDDGVVARMAPDRFHVTTTTGGAARVFRHMEDYLQTEFPELDVWLTSSTEQWSVIAVNGPKARQLIAPLVDGIDLDPDSFGHMQVREGTICGVPTRLMRVSFTGELGFEINVPSGHGREVWERLHARLPEFGGCVYGTETMHILRAEKGFIIVGQDTDGTVTPHDAGLGWAVSRKKKDFVGKRSLARPDLVAEGRRELIGLMTADPAVVLEEGAQLIASEIRNDLGRLDMIGHVTSSYRSAALDRSVAMALLEDGFNRIGDEVLVDTPEGAVRCEVVKPVFVDPKNEALRAV